MCHKPDIVVSEACIAEDVVVVAENSNKLSIVKFYSSQHIRVYSEPQYVGFDFRWLNVDTWDAREFFGKEGSIVMINSQVLLPVCECD